MMSGRAVVLRNNHGFEVQPPVVWLKPGDTFTVRNLTDSRVHVSFPTLPMSPREAYIEPRDQYVFTVGEAERGIYDYWVEVSVDALKGLTLRARGGSDPRIIIDY